MTGIGIFVSFLAVLQYVRTPPGLAGYGFGASALTASVVYLLPGGIAGHPRRPVRRPGGRPGGWRRRRCWSAPSAVSPVSSLLAVLRGAPVGRRRRRAAHPARRSPSPTPRCPPWSCRRSARRRPGWPTRSTPSPGRWARRWAARWRSPCSPPTSTRPPACPGPRPTPWSRCVGVASSAAVGAAALGGWRGHRERRPGRPRRGRAGDGRAPASGHRCPACTDAFPAAPRRAGDGTGRSGAPRTTSRTDGQPVDGQHARPDRRTTMTGPTGSHRHPADDAGTTTRDPETRLSGNTVQRTTPTATQTATAPATPPPGRQHHRQAGRLRAHRRRPEADHRRHGQAHAEGVQPGQPDR